MDTQVEAALKRWPDVPHCYGWLALDARGDWYMRDERAQAAGPFPAVRGSRVEHEKLRGFITRNYAADSRGAWYFQNGPQRVYVELEATPYVWRVRAPVTGSTPVVESHTHQPAIVRSSWLDEQGRLYLDTDIGFGIVHTQDMDAAADSVTNGAWVPQSCRAEDLPSKFGFVRQPAPDEGR